MGDYAIYVWGSFGLLIVAIIGEAVQLLCRGRAQRHKINTTGYSREGQVQQ
jgi:heme exporter protein CcmD